MCPLRLPPPTATSGCSGSPGWTSWRSPVRTRGSCFWRTGARCRRAWTRLRRAGVPPFLRLVRADARGKRVSETRGIGVGDLRHGPCDPLCAAQSRRQAGVRRGNASRGGRFRALRQRWRVRRVSCRPRRKQLVRRLVGSSGRRTRRRLHMFGPQGGVPARSRPGSRHLVGVRRGLYCCTPAPEVRPGFRGRLLAA